MENTTQEKENWSCGKCDQEKLGVGEPIPEHFRTCPKRQEKEWFEEAVERVEVRINRHSPMPNFEIKEICAREIVSEVLEPLIAQAESQGAEKEWWEERDMNIFYLYRKEDESGVSGTGFVAEGVHFRSGKVAISWLTKYTSVTVYDDMEAVSAIHGHGGKTIIAWEDDDFINEEGRLVLNGDTGTIEADTGKWLGNFSDTTKPYNETDKIRISEYLLTQPKE